VNGKRWSPKLSSENSTTRSVAFALCIATLFVLLAVGNKLLPMMLHGSSQIARLTLETLFAIVTLTPIAIYSRLFPSDWWRTITGPVRLKILDVLLLLALIAFGSMLFHHNVMRSLTHASPPVVAFGFMRALAEEIVCRGFILCELRRRFGSIASVVVQALAFTAFHVPDFLLLYHRLSLRLLLYIFIAGIVWGIVALRTRSIWPSTVGHLANNIALSI
jgi:membrane protease YdiL (CAAX protease family)